MVMKVALDTNAYADWKRGTHWLETIHSAQEVLLPVTVYGELRYGFACGGRETANVKELHQFLNAPVVTLCHADETTAEQYAYLKAYLRKNGTPLPENDIWIAASCLAHQSTLLTRDQHFSKLPQLSVMFE